MSKQGLEIMGREVNQDLADYAEQHQTPEISDVLRDIAAHALTTLAVCFAAFSGLALLGLWR